MASQASDKHYWHRYTETYEKVFEKIGPVDKILEIGVFKGDSVRWLRERFPQASIFAVDIVPFQTEWPVDDNIKYLQFDQGKNVDVREMLRQVGIDIDLIIEDGSHNPRHQALCLSLCLPQLRRGGVYILEDIHTSHPSSLYSAPEDAENANALKLLLALKHLRESGRSLDDASISALSSSAYFGPFEVERLYKNIHGVEIFKRASLPLMCWNCESFDFDYVKLECRCGSQLYAEADSMTAVIIKN